jgi:hypothetical protein
MNASEANSRHPRLSGLARRIMDYLDIHPHAQDSLEGIVDWWLMEQRITEATSDVRGALRELVDSGLVLEQRPSENPVYRRNPIPPGDPFPSH